MRSVTLRRIISTRQSRLSRFQIRQSNGVKKTGIRLNEELVCNFHTIIFELIATAINIAIKQNEVQDFPN